MANKITSFHLNSFISTASEKLANTKNKNPHTCIIKTIKNIFFKPGQIIFKTYGLLLKVN